MSQIVWLLKNIQKKNRVLLGLALAISIITSAMLLIDPWLTSQLYDRVIVPADPAPLIPILSVMLIVQVVRVLARHGMIMMLEVSSQDMVMCIRHKMFERLQYQDIRFFDAHRTGDLITRMQGDLEYCRHVVAFTSFHILDDVTLLIAAFVLFFVYSTKLALLLLAVVPLIISISSVYHKRIRNRFRELRESRAALNSVTQENIAGHRVVTAFVREEFEKTKFDKKNANFRRVHLLLNKTWLTILPFMESVVILITLITVFVGGYCIMQGEITAGQLAMFTTLSFALTQPIRSIGSYMDDMQRFFASAQKVMEIYYMQRDVSDRETAKPRDTMRGDVAFQNVTFAYTDTPVLKDVSFHIPAGGTLAIMGPTGCGKTTIANLISRLYDVQEGGVTVDGCDVKDWQVQQLRSHIGVATQEVFLYSDTILNNIAYAHPQMSEEEAKDFAQRAAVDEFANYMEDGLHTVVGERGVGLSGGQRQRIALARALASKPAVLILDDTTSALDMETERYIQEQLRTLPFSCTKIIIAGRISSVKSADHILVLNEGRIVQQGTHAQLVKQDGYYRETYLLQNSLSDKTEVTV